MLQFYKIPVEGFGEQLLYKIKTGEWLIYAFTDHYGNVLGVNELQHTVYKVKPTAPPCPY